MSKAEELLDSLSIEDIQPFTSQPDIEGHIVIDKDRIIHVPTELKRIAVQYDSNIETVTFDCPRYWDEHDLSEMNIYINYKLPGNLINNIGQSLVKNLRINEDDENIINFDWTIGPILTNNKGDLPFSVCAKSKTNQDSDEAIRWYTEINTELTISEGMDGSGNIEDNYEDLFPDVINDIISKLDGINATYDEKLEAFNTNATSKTESFDTNAETKTTEFNNNATTKTNEFNSNAIEKTEAFNANANGVLKKSNVFINGLMNAALTNEVEGVENVINDGIECPLFKMEVDGHTNEQVVTQGYNLIGVNDVEETTKNGLTYSIKNGLLKLNGTANALVPLGNILFNIPAEAGKYRFEIFPQNGTWKSGWLGVRGYIDGTQKWYQQIAKTNNTNYVINDRTVEELDGCNRCDVYVASGSTFDNFRCYIQLKKGAEHSPYEPYSNGIPSPSPDYEQPINSIEGSLVFACRGKNLLNYTESSTEWSGATITTKGTTIKYTPQSNGQAGMSHNSNEMNINLKKGETYTFSQEYVSGDKWTSGTLTNTLHLIDSNGIDTQLKLDDFSEKNYLEKHYNSITLDRDIVKVYSECLLYSIVGMTTPIVMHFQLEKGTQATSYEPYIEPNEVTFNLNGEKLRSVGDVKDELVVDLETGDYYKVENVKEVVLTGTRFWANATEGNVTDGFSAYTTIPGISYVSESADKILKCNKLKGVLYSNENIRNITNVVFGGYGNVVIVNVDRKYLDTPDINGFKNWVANNNVLLCYQLATPTTKKLGTLGPDQLLKLATLKGYNYMTVTGIVDGESVNLNSRITYIQNANDYREIQNGKIAKMISNHPKQNMEGIDNTFDDAIDMELFELGGDGKSKQVTTTGKNLLPNNITSQIINGVTVTKNDDGSITLNGTATSYFTLKFTDDPIILQPGTYMQSFHPSGSPTPTGGIFIRSKDSDDNQIFEYSIISTISKTLDVETTIVDYSVAVNVGTVIKNITLYPMLEPGPQATSYEPYTGGQPSPSPDYPQDINSIEGSVEFACRRKNEFNYNDFLSDINSSLVIAGTYNNFTYRSNNITGTTSGIYKFNGKENTSYLLSGKINSSSANGALNVRYTDGTLFTIYNTWDGSQLSQSFSKTTDTTKTIKQLEFSSYGTNTVFELSDFMISQDLTDTNYVYQEPNQVTFNLGQEKLRSVGDVKDELVVDLDTGDYFKVENIGEIIFDGSDDEGWYKTGNTKVNRFGIVLNRISGAGVMSNKWIMSNIDVINLNYILDYADNTSIYVNFSDISENDDLATFKSWLSVNKPIVDYLLQNPTTKKLGTLSAEDLAKLKTFKGYNNVTVNTNLGLMNIRFTYGLDIKKYVDNKIAELSAQLIKGE